MQKGCDKKDIVNMLSALTDAGIWTGINIIVDFPSIVYEEAIETLEELYAHRSLYDNVNVFEFVLSLLTQM